MTAADEAELFAYLDGLRAECPADPRCREMVADLASELNEIVAQEAPHRRPTSRPGRVER